MSANSSQVIDFAYGVTPEGSQNGINLTFKAPEKFLPETLQVFLSSLKLTRGRDFDVQSDNETFVIILDPNDPTRLNVPPLQFEKFELNYVRA